MCYKYLEKGGNKLLKADRYDQLIDQVLGKRMVIADPKEIELANRLLIVKKINVRRLIMELKQLKEFGKEVGLKLAQMNKMDEEKLTLEIIRNVEPKVQYSKELVSWYDELPDELFDQAEAESGAEPQTGTSDDSGIAVSDVIEVIESYKKKAEMLELIEDNDVAPLFKSFDASAYKLPTQLKKAMIEHLKTPTEPETTEEAAGDDQLNEIVELINDCESEDQLVEIYSEYQSIFEDMEIPDDVNEDQLQQMMLDHVASKQPIPEPEKDKPMTLQERLAKLSAKKKADAEAAKRKKDTKAKDKGNEFDWWNPEADDFDADAAFGQVEELKMPDLRKFAKHIGLSIGIGKKKDEILDLVANKVQEIIEGVGASTETGEIEVTAELIADAVKAKDKDALVEMCDQLGIKLNALQKKSIPGMKAKLEEAIADSAPAETKTTPKGRAKLGTKAEAKPAADQSIYSIMEEMVLAGKSEDAITKKVAPLYKEKGKSILFVKKRVSGMIQIIKIDNDLE
jgi:hypothetical protein